MSNNSNDFLHIWKSYNETNSHFLDAYRNIQTRTNTANVQSTSTRRRNTTNTPSLIQQLFSSAGRSPYISDISYSWVYEMPTSSTSTPQNRLTQKQIQENTKTFVYNENNNQLITNTCPISHNDFQTGDILCEINTCKHVFKQGDILLWFDINNLCPVCRKPVAEMSRNTPEQNASSSSHILDEIILTPLFQNSSNSNTYDNNQLTQIMNEALESIFSTSVDI